MNYRSIFSVMVIVASVIFFTIYFRDDMASPQHGKTIPLQLSLRQLDAKTLSSLQGIEHRIQQDYVYALDQKRPERLIAIINELKEKDAAANNNLIRYWEAYALYKLAFYYTENNMETRAKENIESAISLLIGNRYESSDELALLAILKSAYRKYVSVASIHQLSKESIVAATQALQIDSQNMRAYLALGMNDFFTPKIFGGGEKARQYFIKAIAIQHKNDFKNLLPEWGRERAFFYLIKCCQDEQDTIAAQKYYKFSMSEFPNDISIKKFK